MIKKKSRTQINQTQRLRRTSIQLGCPFGTEAVKLHIRFYTFLPNVFLHTYPKPESLWQGEKQKSNSLTYTLRAHVHQLSAAGLHLWKMYTDKGRGGDRPSQCFAKQQVKQMVKVPIQCDITVLKRQNYWLLAFHTLSFLKSFIFFRKYCLFRVHKLMRFNKCIHS